MSDDLERKLNQWGNQTTPPTDPAFANRLESALRSTMLTNEERTGRAFFRPAVIVVALAVIAAIGVFTISGNPTGEAETASLPEDANAEISATTTTTSTTTTDADTTVPPTTTEPTVPESAPTTATTSVPPSEEDSPPRTGTAPPSQDDVDPVDRTTVAPAPNDPEPGDPPATSTPPPTVAAEIARDGRTALITWTVDGDQSQIEGWVLLRTVDDREQIIEVSRDGSIRSFDVPVIDLDATHRVEARTSDGRVIASSEPLAFTSDQP